MMWPCGVNQWRPSQLAAAPASQQSRRSLNQDHVCDLEVWRHSATTPCHQNSSYTPATQLKHQFSNAFCWESLKTTVSNLQPPLPPLHTSTPASFWVRHPFQECSSPSSTLYTSHPSFNSNSSISSKAMLIRARRLKSSETTNG